MNIKDSDCLGREGDKWDSDCLGEEGDKWDQQDAETEFEHPEHHPRT